ncbi:hypothetical protein [Nocardia sp. CA-135398]|uniref:hypothetical protein n=1 Tax=Nocardia sp. CA-135398 TaxID=3239977 RepID=UPI003D9534EA
MTVSSCSFEDVNAEYHPARDIGDGLIVGATVWVDLENGPGGIGDARLVLSIENARTLAESLTQIVMLHDAAEHAAAERAAVQAEAA